MKRMSNAAKRTIPMPGVDLSEQEDRNAPQMPPEYRKIVVRCGYGPSSLTTHYAERAHRSALCGAGTSEPGEPVTTAVCQAYSVEAARRFADSERR